MGRKGRRREEGGISIAQPYSLGCVIIQGHTFPVSCAVLLPVMNTCVLVPPAGKMPAVS